MKRAIEAAIKSAADPARARHGFEHVPGAAAVTDAEQARILAALFSGSPAMTALLEKHPAWLQSVLATDCLAHPRREEGLRREVNGFLRPALQARDYTGAFGHLRQFKQREMLRIGARDLAGIGDTPQIIREISSVADVCLAATLQLCREQLVERLGQPYHQDAEGLWQPTGFCVLGLGKLGGQELNYSSDVDVIFVYTEEGSVFKTPPGSKAPSGSTMPNHSFFKRLAESFVAEVGRPTEDGALYRIDLRLRPEGDAGPFARSLASYENFYAQWGQTWERLMLLKARCVAGDAGLAAEFLEMVQSFRYPRSLSEGALREIAAMKSRTEREVIRHDELDRDVKRGRGGIREIEFVVQTAQILNAGRSPFLQGAQTLPLLEKLAQYKLLAEDEARGLAEAYCFLRNVEHRLQMEHNLQTHTLPADEPGRARLAALMGFARRANFEKALQQHTQFVRRTYEKFVSADEPGAVSPFPKQFKGAEAEWKEILAAHSFREPEHAFKLLEEFAHGPAYAHTSPRTTELAMGLAGRIFAMCPKRSGGGDAPALTLTPTLTLKSAFPEDAERKSKSRSKSKDPDCSPDSTAARRESAQATILSDPDRVLARLDSFISAYGARATLFETWTHNPQLFELLLLLFDRSEFLAEVAIRTPDLVDELVLSGRLRRRKSAEEILAELRRGAGDADQRLWLRRYHQAEFMRIGLRDILGLADYEQNFIELSALADACLQYALETLAKERGLKAPPVAIIGLGKLGGRELNYGSDLDIVFVAADKARAQLHRLQEFAAQVMAMLSSQTELGIAFVTDARLRPDGEKGLLVNTLEAYEDYYRRRAQLWEIQALTRVRAIAGDLKLGMQFEALAARLTDFRGFHGERPPHPGPAAAESRQGESTGGLGHPLTHTPTQSSGATSGLGRRAESKSKSKSRSRSRNVSEEQPQELVSGFPSCLTPSWKKEIARIRLRIEKERTPAGQDALAFKTGRGGLIDAEFIAQAMCLQLGWHEPNTLRALQRVRDEGALPRRDAEKLVENYRMLRRVESILRRWSFEGEAVLPDDAPAFYRVSVRCGFDAPEAFREAVAAWRSGIRDVYRTVFPS